MPDTPSRSDKAWKIAFQRLNAHLPLALFPLRLQVRFATPRMVAGLEEGDMREDLTGEDPVELWVRIYPDDIFVHTHEDKLTEDEYTAAQAYWDELWQVAPQNPAQTTDPAARERVREGALQALADDFGRARARYILQHARPPAVDAAGFPGQEPELPDLERNADSWNEAPRTYLLPDRFVLRLERGAMHREVLGHPIRKQADGSLALGLDPRGNDNDFADTETGRKIPEAIRWMTDFRQAVAYGMGVRIPLEAEDRQGFDRLLVLGWLDPETTDGVQQLKTLFDNHRYKIGGMDILPPGTPTNNTRQETVPRSPDDRSVLENEALQEQPAVGEGLDGRTDDQRLAAALGLPDDFFADLDQSGNKHMLWGVHIHELLVETTLGQALDFWQGSLPPAEREALLNYMTRWVSGRGYYPALRIDDQPYTFLPVFPFSRLDEHLTWLDDPFLQRLWQNALRPLDRWYGQQLGDVLYLQEPEADQRASRIPHLHQALRPEQVQTTFLSILQMHATSMNYRQRFALFDGFFAENPEAAEGELAFFSEKEPDTAALAAVEQGLEAVGFPRPGGLHELYFDRKTYPLAKDEDTDVLLGSEGEVLPKLKNSDQNYLEWLATAELNAVRDDAEQWPSTFRPLLYRLLRYRLLQAGGSEAVRAEIDRLNQLPLAQLRLLLQEHLDCCTYRLDAWIGGLAVRRLEHLRTQEGAPPGIQLGAWGYLENLRPRSEAKSPGEYIPAPSLRHATAAAVLRSGYQANRFSGKTDDQGLFAVSLSSARVKDALFLLEGVRNGQDLAALLGYRLERWMQEYRQDGIPTLAQFIYDLRSAFPFRVQPLQAEGNSVPAEVEEDTSQRVINALDLLEDHREWESQLETSPGADALRRYWAGHLDAEPDAGQVSGLETLLDRLDDDLDAVKDLLAAEGVYQLVGGQVDRAKAALDALTEGDQFVRPEIVEQPRSTTPLTFRMGVLLPDRPMTTIGGAPLSARALASPKINRWLYDKLPGMSIIRVNVRWESEPDAAGQTSVETDHLLLRELFIQPVDLVYMMHLQRENPDTSELRYRIESAIRKRHQLPLTTRIEILEKDRGGFRNFEYTLFAVEPLAAALGKLLLEARSLKPEDFLQANSEARDDAGAFWSPRPLRGYLRNVALQMEDHQESFGRELGNAKSLLDSGEELGYTQLDRSLRRLRSGMFYYAGLGWVKAVPAPVDAVSRLALEDHYRQADALYRDAENRLAEAAARLGAASGQKLSQLLQSLPEGDPQLATETLEDIAKLLFGRFFRVFPEFRLPNAPDISLALGSEELRASRAGFAVERWLQTQSPVRPRMDLYGRAAMLSELFGRSDELRGLELVQLPIRDDKTGPWIGREYGDFVPHADTLSLTLELQQDFDLGHGTFSGILVDEWNELVPDPVVNTGIALQYDQPEMEAPNAVLLATTPADGEVWNWDTLVDAVKDALHLAKKRAVDPDLLKGAFWDQLLPALLGPIEPDNPDNTLLFGGLPSEVIPEETKEGEAARGELDSSDDLADYGLGDMDLGHVISPDE